MADTLVLKEIATSDSSSVFSIRNTTTTNRIIKLSTSLSELSILETIKKLNLPHCLTLIGTFPPTTVSAPSKPHKQYLAYPNFNDRIPLVFPKLKKFQWTSAYTPQKLDLIRIRKYLKQLLLALRGLHENGIVHLDVTPNNLMLDDNEDLVLIDFGLSRKFSGDSRDIHPSCGTPGYIAHEISMGTAYTASPDIYSTGIILGQLLDPYLTKKIPDTRLLGSKLCCCSTTNQIQNSCTDLLENFNYIDSTKQWSFAMKLPSTTDSLEKFPLILQHAVDLLRKMLESDQTARINAEECLAHPFICADDKLFDGTDWESFQVKRKNAKLEFWNRNLDKSWNCMVFERDR